MRKFGLIGYPLGHSFSKAYFTRKFFEEKIRDCSYDNYPLTTIDQLPDLIESDPHLCGLNVTIPYKSEVLRYVHVVDKEAEKIGSVNVLKIKRLRNNIRLFGFNSDITGISDSLKPFLDKGTLKNALIFGTGGSSKSVQYVLKKTGVNFKLISRRSSPDVLTYADVDSRIMETTDLIVNTTPLGMFPDINTKPDIDYSLLTKRHILFDLVYNPEITAFLKSGEERGCTIVTGLKMLHLQAEKAWEIWNSEKS